MNSATPRVAELARREHAVLVGRAATAIALLLRALDLHNEVIAIPANTCYIVAWAVLESGNIPSLVDVDPNSANMLAPPDHARVSIPCHMYGSPAPIERFATGLGRPAFIIEDAALAAGNHIGSLPCGSFGDASIFSFGLDKPLDIEIGGALVSNDAHIMRECRLLLEHVPLWDSDMYRRYTEWDDLYWALHRHDYSLTGLNALYPALFERFRGLVTFRVPGDYWSDLDDAIKALPENRLRRIQQAEDWRAALRDVPVEYLQLDPSASLWKLPVLVTAELRDDALSGLWEAGISTATCWYPSLQSMMQALLPDRVQPETPNADAIAARVIALPLDDSASPALMKRACEVLGRVLN